MILGLMPAAAYAAPGSDFHVEGGTLGTDYTYTGGVLTFATPGDYTVRMAFAGTTTTTDKIEVDGGAEENPVNITLNNVSVNNSCAFELHGTSVVNLTLSGDNSLTSGDYKAGLHVPSGTAITQRPLKTSLLEHGMEALQHGRMKKEL